MHSNVSSMVGSVLKLESFPMRGWDSSALCLVYTYVYSYQRTQRWMYSQQRHLGSLAEQRWWRLVITVYVRPNFPTQSVRNSTAVNTYLPKNLHKYSGVQFITHPIPLPSNLKCCASMTMCEKFQIWISKWYLNRIFISQWTRKVKCYLKWFW